MQSSIWIDVLKDLGGFGGLVAVIGFVAREWVNRRRRQADVEAIHVNTDSKRVEIQDGIIASLQAQLTTAFEQIRILQKDQLVDRRHIARLERALIVNGVELPKFEEQYYGSEP